MKQIDEMRLVTDMEPAMLHRLAEDGYARHRDGDLARALAEGPGRAGSRAVHRSPAAGGAERWWPRSRRGHCGRCCRRRSGTRKPPAPAIAGGPSAGTTSARGFLLVSAVHAAESPAGSGTYWYIKERDFGSTTAGEGVQELGPEVRAPEEDHPAGEDYVRRAARLHGGELDERGPRPHDHE